MLLKDAISSGCPSRLPYPLEIDWIEFTRPYVRGQTGGSSLRYVTSEGCAG
jgi:hypothetical protein